MKTESLAQRQRTLKLVVGFICLFLILTAGTYAVFTNKLHLSHAASTSSWVENFDGSSLNSNFWDASDGAYGMGAINNLHQGYFQPDHVSVNNGYLTLELTQENGQVGSNQNGVISRGGEIATTGTYGYGTYEWRMRTSSTASSPTDTTGKVVSGQISSGFIYVNNSQTELDFEVEGQFPKAAEMTTWNNPDPTKDPTDGDQIEQSATIGNMANEFKTYKMVWSANEVKYYIDDTLVADETSHVPSAPAHVMINHWGTDSTDFGGMASVGITRYMLVDWVSYTAPGDSVPAPTPTTSQPISTPTPTTPQSLPTPTTLPPTPTLTTIPQPTVTVGSSSTNILQNGSFEDSTLSPWYFSTTGGTSGSAEIDSITHSDGNNAAMIYIRRGDAQNVWNIQFGQADVGLTQGRTYTITFWAKASRARTGQLYIQLDAEPWTEYFVQDFSIGTDWQHYTYTFVVPTSVADAEFNFNLGQARGYIWLDDVVMQ